MSIHRSLVSQGKLTRHRNVLRRTERLQALLEDDRWKAGDSPFGLPKVRSIKHKVKKAAKKPGEAAAATAGATPAPAAGGGKAAPGEKAAGPAAKKGDKASPAAKAPAKK